MAQPRERVVSPALEQGLRSGATAPEHQAHPALALRDWGLRVKVLLQGLRRAWAACPVSARLAPQVSR